MASQLKQWHGFISTDVRLRCFQFYFHLTGDNSLSSMCCMQQILLPSKTRVIFRIVNWLVCHRSRPVGRLQASAESLLTPYSLDHRFSGDLGRRE